MGKKESKEKKLLFIGASILIACIIIGSIFITKEVVTKKLSDSYFEYGFNSGQDYVWDRMDAKCLDYGVEIEYKYLHYLDVGCVTTYCEDWCKKIPNDFISPTDYYREVQECEENCIGGIQREMDSENYKVLDRIGCLEQDLMYKNNTYCKDKVYVWLGKETQVK